jgi:hypothetical protein
MAAELEYYKEHVAHGRHIEVQRSTVAALAATLSGALIGVLLKKGSIGKGELPYTVTMIFLGAVAWLLSAKLYERFKLHNAIAKAARDKLDASLSELRKTAEREHKKDFPFTYGLPLHTVWYALFGLITLLGVVLSVIAWRSGS